MNNEVKAAIIAAIVSAVIGLLSFIGNIWAIHNTKKATRDNIVSEKKNIVSNARIDWIQKVRASLAETVVNYRKYFDCYSDFQSINVKKYNNNQKKVKHSQDAKRKLQEVEKFKREFLYSIESLTLYFPVLEENKEKIHKELVDLADEIIRNPQGKKEKLEEFKKKITIYLKKEWDKSKKIEEVENVKNKSKLEERLKIIIFIFGVLSLALLIISFCFKFSLVLILISLTLILILCFITTIFWSNSILKGKKDE